MRYAASEKLEIIQLGVTTPAEICNNHFPESIAGETKFPESYFVTSLSGL